MKYIAVLILCLPWAYASATTVSCGKMEFAYPPQVGKDQILRSELTIRCRFESSRQKVLEDLRENLQKNALRSAKIDYGPLSESYKNLPSDRYEVTETVQDHGTAVIKREIHSALRTEDQVIVENISVAIVSATGDAALTQKNDWAFVVSKKSSTKYEFNYLERTFVKKKGPEFIFRPMALNYLKDDFSDHLKQLNSLIEKQF